MMQDSQASGKELIKDVDMLRAQKAKLECVSSGQTRQQMNEKLIKARADWEKTFDAITDWIAMIDLKGRILRTNRSGEDFTGISSSQILGQSCCKLAHGSDKPIPGCPLQKMLDTHERESIELKVPDTNRWLMVTVDPVADDQGNIIGAVHITRDITERKVTEEALRESEQKLRAIFDAATEGFTLWDSELNLVRDNNSLLNAFALGLQKGDLIGKNILEIAPNIIESERYDQCMEVMKTGKSLFFDTLISHPRFGDRYIEVKAFRVADGLGMVITDITERKKAEATLRESEEKFKSIFDNANDIIASLTKTGKILEINKKVEDILGYKPDELIGKNFMTLGILASKNAARMFHIFKESVKIGGFLVSRNGHNVTEVWVNHKDGYTVLLEANTTTIKKDGKLAGYLSVVRDITERKKMEMELQRAKQFSDNIIDTAQAIILVLDTKGRIVSFNPYMEKISGYRLDEIIGKDWFGTFIPKEIRKILRELFSKAIKGIQTKGNVNAIITKDGNKLQIEWYDKTLKDDKGEIIGLISVGQDITERMKAEETYRTLVDYSLQGLVILQDGRIVFANQAMAMIAGYTLEEMLAFPVEQVQSFVHPDDRELVWNRHRARLNGEKLPERYEFRGIRKDGSVCWLEVYAVRIYFHGKPAIQASYVDITERKRTEYLIRNSEEKFHLAMEATNDAIWDWNLLTNEVYRNPRHATMLGYEPHELTTSQDEWEKRIHPDDREIVLKITEEHLAGTRESVEVEYRLITRSGDYIWVLGRGKVVKCSNDGSPLRMIGTNIDITERKRAEEKLRESKLQLEMAINASNTGLWDWDLKTNKVYFSPEWKQQIGYEEWELSNDFSEWQNRLHPDDLERAISTVQKYLENPYPDYENEFRFRHKDGSYRWILAKASIITDEQEKPIKMLGSHVDITEIKKAEESLQLSEEKFRNLFNNAEVGMFRSRLDGSEFLESNDKYLSILGMTREDAIGKPTTILWVDPKERKEMVKILKAKGYVNGLECGLFNKAGEVITCITSLKLYPETGILEGSIIDITARKKAEEKNKVFSDAINSAFDGFILNDLKENITYVNETTCRMFGYTREELLKLKVTNLDADPAFAKKVVKEIAANGKWSGEVTNIRKNGEKFPCLLSAFIIKDDKGNLKGTMGILRDITERKRTEKTLQASEERFRDIFESVGIGLYRTTPDGQILMANPALVTMLGYSSFEELARRNLEEEGFEPNYPRSEFKERIESDGQVVGLESAWLRLDGKVLFVRESARAVRDSAGNTLYYQGTIENITEQKKVEGELREYQMKLKTMASKMLMSEERQRKHLATGLHDSICQKLVLTKLTLESSLPLVSNSNVSASLKVACGAIGEMIEQADSLTFELSNPVLHQLGFVVALEKYLTEEIHKKHGIAFELKGDERLNIRNEDIKNCLFRVSRELLMNVIKHAHAHKVKVSARRTTNQICVSIQDDGVGFKQSKTGDTIPQTTRFGLFSVREQLEYMGGHLKIESEPGQGTKATVVIPVEEIAAV